MRCETFLERYDGLEPGRAPAPALARHRASCASCRAQASALEAALAGEGGARLAADEALAERARLEDRVMTAVRLLPSPRRDFSLRDWILAGAILAASMILVPVGDYFARFDEVFGASYALPLSLVLGLGLTAYGALFVGAHLDEVQGFMDRRARSQP